LKDVVEAGLSLRPLRSKAFNRKERGGVAEDAKKSNSPKENLGEHHGL
jgi:hypothetical protein